MDKTDIERMIAMDTHIKLFKWLVGVSMAAVVVTAGGLSSWINAQSTEVASLQTTVRDQSKSIDKNELWLERTSEKTNSMQTDISGIHITMRHQAKTLDEIKSILTHVHKLKP